MGLLMGNFWVNCLHSSLSIHTPKFPWGCCPCNYHWPIKANCIFVWNKDNGFSWPVILFTVMSECCVKRVSCKTWNGTLTNSQGWQNASKYEYFPCQRYSPVNTSKYWKILANTGRLNWPPWNYLHSTFIGVISIILVNWLNIYTKV